MRPTPIAPEQRLSQALQARCGRFTLIELLVVIAIIGILASMLLPSLSRAKETGHKANCQSLIKQLHLSAILYAEDNDATYVQTFAENTAWTERLVAQKYATTPYSQFYCGKVSTQYAYRWWPGYGYVEYNQGNNLQGKKVAFVKAPAITSMFADVNLLHAVTGTSSYYVIEILERGSQYMKTVANYDSGFLGRHAGGDNFIFVDGHVEYLRDPKGLTLRMRGVAGYGNRDLFPFNIDNDTDPNG